MFTLRCNRYYQLLILRNRHSSGKYSTLAVCSFMQLICELPIYPCARKMLEWQSADSFFTSSDCPIRQRAEPQDEDRRRWQQSGAGRLFGRRPPRPRRRSGTGATRHLSIRFRFIPREIRVRGSPMIHYSPGTQSKLRVHFTLRGKMRRRTTQKRNKERESVLKGINLL